MSTLVHEIWEETTDDGVLHSCCLAGRFGEKCRNSLGANARLLTKFEAGSHYEAMTIYNRYLGREDFTSELDEDYLPYQDEWRQ